MLCANIVHILMIILQLGCAYIAYKSHVDLKSNGSSAFWWYMWTGFVLMALRRISAFLIFNGVDLPDLWLLDTILLPATITIVLFVGMFKVYEYNYRRNKLIKNQTEQLKELTEKLVGSPFDEEYR